MIVLDENLLSLQADRAIQKWYRGRVRYITDLRPGTTIKDESIPILLHQVKQATFVTTNVSDFWKRVEANRRYCIICLPLPNQRLFLLPGLLQKLLSHSDLNTKKSRSGKVVRAGKEKIQYYTTHGIQDIRDISW